MLDIKVQYIAANYYLDGTCALDFLVDDEGDYAIEIFGSIAEVEQHMKRMQKRYKQKGVDDYDKFVNACTLSRDNEGSNYLTIFNMAHHAAWYTFPMENIMIIQGTYSDSFYDYQIY